MSIIDIYAVRGGSSGKVRGALAQLESDWSLCDQYLIFFLFIKQTSYFLLILTTNRTICWECFISIINIQCCVALIKATELTVNKEWLECVNYCILYFFIFEHFACMGHQFYDLSVSAGNLRPHNISMCILSQTIQNNLFNFKVNVLKHTGWRTKSVELPQHVQSGLYQQRKFPSLTLLLRCSCTESQFFSVRLLQTHLQLWHISPILFLYDRPTCHQGHSVPWEFSFIFFLLVFLSLPVSLICLESLSSDAAFIIQHRLLSHWETVPSRLMRFQLNHLPLDTNHFILMNFLIKQLLQS